MGRKAKTLDRVSIAGGDLLINFGNSPARVARDIANTGSSPLYYKPEVGGTWQLIKDPNGEPVRAKSATDTAALRRARDLLSRSVKSVAGIGGTGREAKSASQCLMLDVLDWMERRPCTPTKRMAIRHAYGKARAWLADHNPKMTVADFDEGELDAFVRWFGAQTSERTGRPFAVATVEAAVAYLMQAWRDAQHKVTFANGDRRMLCLPAAHMIRRGSDDTIAKTLGRRHDEKREKSWHEPAVWAAVLNALDMDRPGDAELFRVLVAGLWTGARTKHIAQCQWLSARELDFRGWGVDFIDLDAGVPVEWRAKNKRRADLPLHPGLNAHLLDWGREWLIDTVNTDDVATTDWIGGLRLLAQRFNAATKRAGIGHITLSETRHTVVSHLERERVSDAEIARYAGHSRSFTSSKYAHRTPDYLQGALGAVEAYMAEVAASCRHELHVK